MSRQEANEQKLTWPYCQSTQKQNKSGDRNLMALLLDDLFSATYRIVIMTQKWKARESFMFKKKPTLFLKVWKFTGEDKDISLCGCLFLNARQKAQTIFVSENSFSINKNQFWENHCLCHGLSKTLNLFLTFAHQWRLGRTVLPMQCSIKQKSHTNRHVKERERRKKITIYFSSGASLV